MKKFLLSLLLIFFSVHTFSLSRQNYISLEKQNVRLKNFGFRLVAVTDATSNKRIIGYVEKQVTYKPVVAFLAKDVVEEFESFIKRNLLPAPAEHDLIVRVNDLTVYETHSNMNETAVANVNLTFIFKKDEHYFEKLTISHHLSKTVFEHVTQWLPEIIAKTIAQCFDTFYDRAMKHTLDQVEITEKELKEKPLTYNERKEIYLSADRSEKGLYKTFFDFQEGTPDLITDFDVEYKTKTTEDGKIRLRYAQIADTKTGKQIDDVWGFTDGKHVFVYNGTRYLQLFKDKKDYYSGIKVKDETTMQVAGLMAGLLGAAIASAAAPYHKVRLDIVTGQFVFQDDPYFRTGAAGEDEKVVKLFSSSYNSNNSKLYLSVNDEFQCILKKETWYRYTVSNAGDTIMLTVVSENGFQTTKAIVTKPGNADIYVIIDKKKKAPLVNKIYSQKAEGIESMMTRKNRIYKNTEGPDNLK